jgi:hypothetical protein
MAVGNNALWVFKEPSEENESVFYHTPALDETYGKIYPSSHSSISLGCVGRAINFNDDIVFFSQRGMEGVSGDINSEQFVAHRSTTIDRKLLKTDKYEDMILIEWEGYLLVIIESDIFLADSRAVFTNENHYEYEWFHWNFGDQVITFARVYDGILYLATADGEIYTLTGEDGEDSQGFSENGKEIFNKIDSYWTTPKDKFGAPNKLKTTNKKGCVIEAVGDLNIYAKTNLDNEFELIDSETGVEDYIVSKIKKKKFKDIQLKFESNGFFRLDSATLEAIIGGYIK